MCLLRAALWVFIALAFLPGMALAQAQPQPVVSPPQAQSAQPIGQQSIQPVAPPVTQPAAQSTAQPAAQTAAPVPQPQAQFSMQAQDYTLPTWQNLIRAMIRFGALDLSDENIVDDYVLITECAVYQQFFNNEFKWNQVRQAIRKSVQMNIASFPIAFRYEASTPVGRYDFNAKLLRFEKESAVSGVNMITIPAGQDVCSPHQAKFLPHTFRALLSSPIFVEGIPLAEMEAQNLIARMSNLSRGQRIVYLRYNLRIIAIEPLVKRGAKTRRNIMRYSQTELQKEREVSFNARVDTIEIYEDPEYTRLLTIVRP